MKNFPSLRLPLAVLLALFVGSACSHLSFDVLIPKKLIEAQIQRTFPTVKSKGLVAVKLQQPKLEFLGSENRLRVIAQVEVQLLGIVPVPGSASVTGSLSYHPETASFHYSDVKIERFDLQGIPAGSYDEITGMLGSALLNSLGGLEVYRLDPKDAKENLAKAVLKGIKVRDEGVLVTLGL